MAETQTYSCARCASEFPRTARHTELVRRDFIEMPQPARIERLCWDCFERYVEEFLGEEFHPVDTDEPVA
jgi:hypothetical protein